MGCFNVTCSVSRLPITDQTPIRAFILGKPAQPANGPFFHPSDLYVPLATGLLGEYNDYGGIADCTPSESFEIARKYFFPLSQAEPVEDFVRDATYGDKNSMAQPVTLKKTTFEPAVAFVREDIYQKILSLYQSYRYGAAVDTAYKISRESIKTELEIIREAVKDASETWASVQKHTPNSILSMDYLVYSELQPKDFGDAHFNLIPIFYSVEGDMSYHALAPYRKELMDRLSKQGSIDDKTVDLAMEIAEHSHFNFMLRRLHTMWQPFTNLVGQDTPFELHRIFNEAVSSICAAKIQKEIEEQKAFDAATAPKSKSKSKAKSKAKPSAPGKPS